MDGWLDIVEVTIAGISTMTVRTFELGEVEGLLVVVDTLPEAWIVIVDMIPATADVMSEQDEVLFVRVAAASLVGAYENKVLGTCVLFADNIEVVYACDAICTTVIVLGGSDTIRTDGVAV